MGDEQSKETREPTTSIDKKEEDRKAKVDKLFKSIGCLFQGEDSKEVKHMSFMSRLVNEMKDRQLSVISENWFDSKKSVKKFENIFLNVISENKKLANIYYDSIS